VAQLAKDVRDGKPGAAHEFVHWAATLAEGLIALLGERAK
jgi:hypothetical protein